MINGGSVEDWLGRRLEHDPGVAGSSLAFTTKPVISLHVEPRSTLRSRSQIVNWSSPRQLRFLRILCLLRYLLASCSQAHLPL